VIVFDDIGQWRQERRSELKAGVTLGLVPTMGALHGGHVSLVRRSLAENARTLVSIFVNPTQFNDPGDLAAYPRPLDADLDLLRAEGVDFVLRPEPGQMYPDGYGYHVTERPMSERLEGAWRPGHFDGVLTVVMKLLQLASAERAYFGEKDWQQLALVRGMVRAFFVPTEIVACPTVRDASGLALSSRNARLPGGDVAKAAQFHAALVGAPTATAAREQLRDAGFIVEYVEDVEGRRLGAVRLGDVRLIDNVALEVPA
jgi:pantoate--beta-alanine ligase